MSIFKTANILILKRPFMRFMILLGLALGVLFTSGCSSKEKVEIPPSPIGFKKMVNVLIDIHIAESVNQQVTIKRDTLFEKKKMEHRYEDVFKTHGISGTDYQTAFQYYVAQPDSFDIIYEQVIERLTVMSTTIKSEKGEKLKAKLEEKKKKEKEKGSKEENKEIVDPKYKSIKERIDSLGSKKERKR